jgi:DHA2 family multidrug resistance protein
MLIAGRASNLIDPRITILTGILLLVVSLWMMTGFELGMDQSLVILSGTIQGLGLGLVVLPLNLLALATLPAVLRTEAASLYSLARSIGGSVAISVMTALIASNTQTSHADLGTHVTTTSAPFLTVGLLERAGFQGAQVMQFIDAEINRQAIMIAYIDDYWVMMWAAILIIPLIAILKGGKSGEEMPMPDGH